MAKKIHADESITDETTVARAAVLRTLDGVDVDEADAMAGVAAREARRHQEEVHTPRRLSTAAYEELAGLLGYNPRNGQIRRVLPLTALYLLSPEELASAERPRSED